MAKKSNRRASAAAAPVAAAPAKPATTPAAPAVEEVEPASSSRSAEMEADLKALASAAKSKGKKALFMHAAAAAAADDSDADQDSDAEDVDFVNDSGDDSADEEDDAMEQSGDDEEEEEGEEDEDAMEVDSISPADARSIAQKVKQRVLVCSSRGISHRQRHLMGDLMTMLPHGKKESKLDQKKNLGSLNEIAELTNCNKVLYLESRRGTDLYMWLSHAPNGPSIKFEVVNIHTMDELNMTGNHLKFSRAILSFDATFEETPQTRIMKELLAQTFNTPRGHRRSKPFFDHVMSFSYSDDRVWVRNYQITETSPAGTVTKANSTSTEVALNEVGPRFVLNPIKLFQGSFGGIGLWENERYLTPAAVRRAERAEVGDKHASKEEKKVERVERSKASEMPKDPLASVFRD